LSFPSTTCPQVLFEQAISHLPSTPPFASHFTSLSAPSLPLFLTFFSYCSIHVANHPLFTPPPYHLSSPLNSMHLAVHKSSCSLHPFTKWQKNSQLNTQSSHSLSSITGIPTRSLPALVPFPLILRPSIPPPTSTQKEITRKTRCYAMYPQQCFPVFQTRAKARQTSQNASNQRLVRPNATQNHAERRKGKKTIQRKMLHTLKCRRGQRSVHPLRLRTWIKYPSPPRLSGEALSIPNF
jgi:hypothetical protein